MTHRRKARRHMVAAAGGIAALVAGSVAIAQANAAPTTPTADIEPRMLSSQEAGTLAASLTEELAQDAGAYYDAASDTLVVNVLDESAADEVEAAGAQARVVDNSLSELADAHEMVGDFAVPGTAWSVDPVTNSIKVTVDSTVTGEELAAVQDGVAEMGGMATMEQAEGTFEPYVAGGDAILTGGARCSLGFNVTTSAGTPGFLTAGHCGAAGTAWTDSEGAELGSTTDSVFPGSDYSIVEYSGTVDAPSAVNLYDGTTQEITEAGEAVVGQEVARSGSTTGLHDGTVEALDVSVEYAEGTVDGMIQTNVCAEPGDSGGALFSGTTALGLTSGGSGDCTSGGTTFFYPVTDALEATGASLP